MQTRGSPGRRMGWTSSLLISVLATVVAMALMFWARGAFQIRTLPERVMEWVLLFVPLEAFEKGVQQLGPLAKEIALLVAIGGMSLTLVGLGLAVLRGAWPGWAVLLLGPLLYLFAIAVVMPVTGAGFFARDLFQNVGLVNASYLGLALAYACTLLLARLALGGSQMVPNRAAPRSQERRPLLVGLAGVLASYAAAAWLGRQGTATVSNLPLATVKPPGATPSPAAQAAPTVLRGVAPGTMVAVASPPPTGVAAAAAQVTGDSLPVPAPARELSRDKDGSLTAAGRQAGELAPLITANESFYVVTKNAGRDPILKPEAWRVIVDGEVNSPIQIDYRTLRQLPAVEQVKTLECISNFTAECQLTAFGCDLISTARWKGARVKDIIELAGGAKPSAVSLGVLSTDEFSSALPLEAAMDPETILAYEMNGQVLPYEHGYPARLLVPGRYGMKNAKWVMALRPMSQQFTDWYGQRNWNREAIVKTMSRIDVPAPGAELSAGSQRIAGVAYAGDRGVKTVEFSADGGASWQPAIFIEPPGGKDVWVRWQGSFNALPDRRLKLTTRATDGAGALQTETFSLPQPDGGSGRHSVEVRVRSA